MFAFTILLTHHLSAPGLIGYALFAGNLMNMTRYSIAPLVALWSLAIEEHFYLVWPFLTRYLSLPVLLGTLLLLVVAEPLLRIGAVLAHLPPMATYYLTPFRLDGLACGALLALIELTGRGKAQIRRWGGWVSLALWAILVAVEISVPSFTRESGSLLFNDMGYPLAAWASFAGIGWVAWNADSLVSRLLALRPMAWIGRISYGLSLYHILVLDTMRRLLHIPPGVAGGHATQLLILIDLPLTLLVAWISFSLLESPVLRWGHRLTRGDEPARAHHFA